MYRIIRNFSCSSGEEIIQGTVFFASFLFYSPSSWTMSIIRGRCEKKKRKEEEDALRS